MKPSAYGPCGLFCGACGAPDCDGCRSDRTDDLVRTCRFKRCADEKRVDFCSFCDEFPCRPLDEFMNDEWPHHWTMRPNLEYIKKNGLEKWLDLQRKEWVCPGCGADIIWYQKTCPCGQVLDGWDPPPSYQKK